MTLSTLCPIMADVNQTAELLKAVLTIAFIVFLAACAGAVLVIQTVLSVQEKKVYGLILPSVTFIFTLFELADNIINKYLPRTYTLLDGTVIAAGPYSDGFVGLFLLRNIPTAVLVAVFMICRGIMAGKLPTAELKHKSAD